MTCGYEPQVQPPPGPHHHGEAKPPIKMISLKCLKRRNRSSRLKFLSLKWLKCRRPKAEFIIGARYIDIRPIERGIGARCIGIGAIERGVTAPRIPIRGIELACPLICAVAIEAAKTHGTTQPGRTNFLQFIAL